MTTMSGNTVIEIEGLTKSFSTPSGEFTALMEITLRVDSGRLVALTGKSGSGKSTLLNMIAGIDRPTSGRIAVAGANLGDLSETALAKWRGKNVGFVFQFFQLLPTLTIMENVMLPMDFSNTYRQRERQEKAMSLLEGVGIAEQARKLPATLSGGQQQRAAIARALANDPPVLLADEPTGNLDSQTAGAIFELFRAVTDAGKTVVVATHEKEFSHYFESSITLSDGRIAAPAGASR